MLGLPSTTEVMRVMPKVAFYEHLKLKAQEKKLFVAQIEKITLANSIKPSTMNIASGEKHSEILVLRIDLKQKHIEGLLLEAIARQNDHPLVFACQYLNELCIYVYRQKLYNTGWMLDSSSVFNTSASNIDQLWDSICSQVAFGKNTTDSFEDLDAQLALHERVLTLDKEIDQLSSRSRKEKQPAKKNSLHEEARIKKEELKRLKAGDNGEA